MLPAIKFLHLLAAVGLFSLTLVCTTNFFYNKKIANKAILLLMLLSVMALATGSFIVYPTHFSFSTPWIQAAYTLVMFFILLNMAMLYKPNFKNLKTMLVLICVLILIVHGAVCKGLLFPLESLTTYNLIKILHVINAAGLFAAIGYSFYAWHLRKDSFVIILLVIPLAFFQLISGFTLLSIKPFSFSELWVKASIISFFGLVVFWFGFTYFLLFPKKRISQGILLTLSMAALCNMIFFMAAKI